MKKLHLIIGLSLVFMTGLDAQNYLEMIDSGEYTVAQIKAEAERHFSSRDLGKGSGYYPFQRWLYLAEKLQDDQGYLPNTLERLSEVQAYEAYLNETSSGRANMFDFWEEVAHFFVERKTILDSYDTPGTESVASYFFRPS